MSLFTTVNSEDKVIGAERRSTIHSQGLIHRVVRILLLNSKGELLLQLRAHKDDSFAGRWDQSAGGHVDADEDYEQAAYRELKEELGVDGIKLKEIGKFYTDGRDGEKIIRRFNMVYIGSYDGEFKLQTQEVQSVKWISKDGLLKEFMTNPEGFTLGLRTVIEKYRDVIFL